MDVTVFDTYVKNSKGVTMHFDVFMPKGKTVNDAIKSAREWLKSIGEPNAKVTTNECRLCHVQTAKPNELKDLKDKGYFIYKMSGCP